MLSLQRLRKSMGVLIGTLSMGPRRSLSSKGVIGGGDDTTHVIPAQAGIHWLTGFRVGDDEALLPIPFVNPFLLPVAAQRNDSFAQQLRCHTAGSDHLADDYAQPAK